MLEQQYTYNIADQIQRSGTAIGANHREAIAAESEIDFVHKLAIAQKECNETLYWLKVLHGAEFINKTYYEKLLADVEELYRVITASVKTAKANIEQ